MALPLDGRPLLRGGARDRPHRRRTYRGELHPGSPRGLRLPGQDLSAYLPAHGAAIVSWLRSVDEAAAWANLDRLPREADLERWHAQPDVVPFSLLAAGRLVAYGELWEDPDADEAEVARLVVAPDLRGRGLGRALTRALADEARRRGFAEVWLRVVPENAAARRAYAAAGFRRATPDEEAAFNAGQPRSYVWMRDSNGGLESRQHDE